MNTDIDIRQEVEKIVRGRDRKAPDYVLVGDVVDLCNRVRAAQKEREAQKCDAIARNMRQALQADNLTETLNVQIRLRMATANDCAAAVPDTAPAGC